VHPYVFPLSLSVPAPSDTSLRVRQVAPGWSDGPVDIPGILGGRTECGGELEAEGSECGCAFVGGAVYHVEEGGLRLTRSKFEFTLFGFFSLSLVARKNWDAVRVVDIIIDVSPASKNFNGMI
jgi:hypothetical protein